MQPIFTELGSVWMVPSMYDGSFNPLPLTRKRNCASAVIAVMARMINRMVFFIVGCNQMTLRRQRYTIFATKQSLEQVFDVSFVMKSSACPHDIRLHHHLFFLTTLIIFYIFIKFAILVLYCHPSAIQFLRTDFIPRILLRIPPFN